MIFLPHHVVMKNCILCAVGVLALLICNYARSRLSKNLKSIKAKHVVVTGASSGIGREFAIFFAKRKYDLTIVGRRQPEL